MLLKAPWAPGCRGGWNFSEAQSQGEFEDLYKIFFGTNCYKSHLKLEKQLMLRSECQAPSASLLLIFNNIKASNITGFAHLQPQHEKLGEAFWGGLAALLVLPEQELQICVFQEEEEAPKAGILLWCFIKRIKGRKREQVQTCWCT